MATAGAVPARAAMLMVSGTTRVLVATTPVDLRGSFNRLYGLVIDHLKGDPLSGNLFLFTNRRRNRVKILGGTAAVCWSAPNASSVANSRFPSAILARSACAARSSAPLIHGLEVKSKKNWYRR